MALRTWGRVLVTALAVGLLASTSQLGVAFGLGIVRLDRTFTAAEENQWMAQLAWLTWFPIVAAVAGAIAADRRAVRHGYHGGTGSRMLYSIAASIGAAVAVPLAMLPARGADVPTGDPVLIIGLSAGLGAIAGLFAAIAVLSQDALFWNVVVVTAGAWLLGLISMGQSLGDPQPAVRLGVYDPTTLSTGTAQRLGVITMPLLALAAGAITAGLGRWLSRPSRTLAAAGVVGPAMLSLAYLVAGPGTDADKYQAAPYWGALVAVAAGALGSMLATAIRRPAPADLSPTPDAGPDRATPDRATDATPDRSPADHPQSPDRPTRDFGTLDQDGREGGAATPDSPTPDLPTDKPPLRKRGRRGSRAEAFAPPGAPPANPPYTGQEPGTATAATGRSGPDRNPPGPPLAPEWAAGVVNPSAGRPQSGPPRSPTAPEAAAAFSVGRQAAGGKGPGPELTPAAQPEPDQATEKRPRRGLFGRRKPAPPPVELPAQRKDEPRPETPAPAGDAGPAPIPRRDEEYVDWVSGLADPEQR
ncbi:hypothetical protein K1W54_07960 [Micromonospora sp. CPCC 205371]|nr:hypothetical protein [Micromonospora sp. CPCC 205371]